MRRNLAIVAACLLALALLVPALGAARATAAVAVQCEVRVWLDGTPTGPRRAVDPAQYPALCVAPTAKPTNTPRPTKAPTNTPRPTQVPTATATGVPATATAIPPTATGVPPTATAVPPTVTVVPSPAPGGEIVVNPGQSIQAAVDSAPAGAVVRVRAGVYNQSVTVPRPLTLAGEPGAILDGGCRITDPATHAIVIDDIPDVTIQGLEIRNYQGSGVQVYGPDADRVAALGNYIHDYACAGGSNTTWAGASWYYAGDHARIVGNTIKFRAAAPTRSGQNGVWFKTTTRNPSGGFHTVTDNIVVGGWDGIGGEGEDDPHGIWDGNATVLRNTVSDCWDDGISAEGFTGNSHFSDNTITDCGAGIANASRYNSGEVWFERNTIRSAALGYYNTQLCFKGGDGGTQVAHIVGNACHVTVGDGLVQTNSGLATLIVTDNVWETGRYVFELTGTPAAGSLFDRDCMYTTDPTRFVKYANVRYLSLADLQQYTGQEQHGRLGPCGP